MRKCSVEAVETCMLGRVELDTGKTGLKEFSCPYCRYFTYKHREKIYQVAKKQAPSIFSQLTVC